MDTQIEYFLKVCEYGSIGKAARSLHVTPQAVSKAINGFEEKLGYKILARYSDGCSPTEKGLEIQRIGVRMQRFQQEMLRQLYELDQQTVLSEEVHVGMWHGFSTIMPPSDFSDFNRLHPEIQLCVHGYNSPEECEAALIRGEVDLAFCRKATAGCGFTCLQRHESTVYLMVNNKNKLSEHRKVNLEDLRGEKLIADYRMVGTEYEFREQLDRAKITPSLILPFLSDSLKRKLVMEDNYVAFSYCPTAWLPYGIVPVIVSGLNKYEESDFSRATDRHLSEAAQKFVDYIVPRFKKDIFGQRLGKN